MLRSVFTIINLFFVLLLYSQSGLSSQGDARSDSNQPLLPNLQYDGGIKLYLSTSSYFYDVGEPVLCHLMAANAENLQPINYVLPCRISLFNSRGQKVYSKIIESSMGSVNKVFDTSYFRFGGEYTILGECRLNGKRISINRKIIVQQTIKKSAFIEINTWKEQYIAGDTLKMRINIRNSNGVAARNQRLMIIEIYNEDHKDTTIAFTNADGTLDFYKNINYSYSENELVYLVKGFIDSRWESKAERINLNTGMVNISVCLENGHYKIGKENSIVIFTSNDFGDLVKSSCILFNIKTKDSILTETNDFGLGKFKLPVGDSIQNYVVFSPKNRNFFYPLQTNIESQAEIKVVNKSRKGITYLLSSDTLMDARFVCHLRGHLMIDTILAVGPLGKFVFVSVESVMPGVLQAIVFNKRSELLAQKLNFINRYKKLKVETAWDSRTFDQTHDHLLTVKVTDELNKPVEGVFNLSITDQKNNLIIEDKQSHLSESLLFESDLTYPVKDIGKLWKYTSVNNDSLIDLFLNGCKLNEIYLPRILQSPKKTTVCYYQLVLERAYSGNSNELYQEVRKITVKSSKGKFQTKLNQRNEIYLPLDSVAFPCIFIIHGITRDKLYVNETHAKLALKLLDSPNISTLERDSFYQIASTLPQIYNPKLEVRDEGENSKSISTGMRNYNSYSSVFNRSIFFKTGLRGYASLAGLCSGVTVTAIGLSGRGSRTDGTAVYIDGVKLISPNDVPVVGRSELIYTNMGFWGSGSSGTNYGGNYYSYYPNTIRSHEYEVKKYRPNGVSLSDYQNFKYMVSKWDDKPKLTTFFWETGLVTDKNGMFLRVLKMPEKMMVYHLNIEGISKEGSCAEYDTILKVQQAVYMTVKAPQKLLSTDTAEIICTVYNNSDINRELSLQMDLPEGFKKESFYLYAGKNKTIVIPYHSYDKHLLRLELKERNSYLPLQTIESNIEIEDKLFKEKKLFSLGNFKDQIVEVSPKALLSVVKIHFYRSAAANLEDKLIQMIREPYGCFEQVSSTNYPNIMAYQYLKEAAKNEMDYNLVQKRQILINGYGKLCNYETRNGGFSWYGDGFGNEALTAMGLLQFEKLSKCDVVVSRELVERSKRWLYKSRNEHGVFIQSKGRYGFANTSQDVAHAYITYVLSELGDSNLKQSVNQIEDKLYKAPNFYNEALLFAIYLKQNEKIKAHNMYNRILGESIGLMESKNVQRVPIYTIVNSWYGAAVNESLCIIANSIFTSGMNEFLPLANRIGKYITGQDFYSLGNMQTEAMAIETIIYFQKPSEIKSINSIKACINDKLVEFKVNPERNQAIDIDEYLQKGINTVRIINDSAGKINADLQACSYYKENIMLDYDKDLKFEANYSLKKAEVGDLIDYNISIINISNKILPQTVAVIPLPGGVSIQPAELLFLKKQKIIDFYEMDKGRIIFYFEEIDCQQKVNFSLKLTCEVKGVYDTSLCYLYKYYQANHKTVFQPGKLVIE